MSKTILYNKKANFNYDIEDKLECGISLLGTEVKSIRENNISFNDCFVKIKNDELILTGMHISVYRFGNIFNHEPLRERKLLAHKKEIRKWKRKTQENGYSIVPISIYFNKDNRVKVQIGLGRGKKSYDKRESIKAKDLQRDIRREFKDKFKINWNVTFYFCLCFYLKLGVMYEKNNKYF